MNINLMQRFMHMLDFFLRTKDDIFLSLFNISYSQTRSVLIIFIRTIFVSFISFYLCIISDRPYNVIFMIHFLYFLSVAIMSGTVFIKNTLIPLITNSLVANSFETNEEFKLFLKKFINLSLFYNVFQNMLAPGIILLFFSIQENKMLEFLCLVLFTISIIFFKYSINIVTLLQGIDIQNKLKRNTSSDFIITIILTAFLTMIVDKFSLENIILFLTNINIWFYVLLAFISIITFSWILDKASVKIRALINDSL